MDGVIPENASAPGSTLVGGLKAESAGNSPASSVGGQVRALKKQLPIARNPASGSGYERPERARTSHACEPCRERKTKCDGERPSCRRCLHTGSQCHYGYGKGWKKRKTAEDLSITSSKLARYEDLLNEIFPLVGDNVRDMITQARQQSFPITNGNESADSSTPASSNAVDGETKSNSPSLNRLPLPPLPTAMTQSPSPFPGPARPVTRPLPSESSYSPSQLSSSVSGSRKSPVTDDFGSNPAIRLPSITRHGFLLEDPTRSQSQGQSP